MKTKKFSDVYIVKSHIKDKYIIYAPLRRRLFWANETAAYQISNYLKSKTAIDDNLTGIVKEYIQELRSAELIDVVPENIKINDKAVIILTQKCNLACPYCYAANAHCNETISFEHIKVIIDHIFKDERNKFFTFIGGGEPTVEWDLFVRSVNYIKKKTVAGQKVHIGLTTNGTLLNFDRIAWLKENDIQIGLSFDILPEVQKINRPFQNQINSFDFVNTSIENMLSQDIIPKIRSTITECNVCRMKEMVEYVIKHYPGIKSIHFEHVSMDGNNSQKYYDDFVENFFVAKGLAQKNGITLKNSIITSMKTLRHNFCNGEFCITPNGEIVACHRVSSKNDTFFNEFLYGSINGKSVIIDDEKLKVFYNNSRKIEDKCNQCFARWNCAGTCTYNKMLYASNKFNCYCEFVKNMVLSELESVLDLKE